MNPVSDGEDDCNSTDSDTSKAAEEVTYCIDEIRRELLEGIKLVPFYFCPPRLPNVIHLNSRIKRRCHYTMVQQRWKKDKGEVVRDILDGKDPFAAATYSEGTKQQTIGLVYFPENAHHYPVTSSTERQTFLAWYHQKRLLGLRQ